MPAIGRTNKPAHVERQQRRRRAKAKTKPRYVLPTPPSGGRGDAPQTRERDMRRAESHKRTYDYERSVRTAYRNKPRSEREEQARQIEGKARRGLKLTREERAVWRTAARRRRRDKMFMRTRVLNDRQRRLLERFTESTEYRDTLASVRSARERRERDDRGRLTKGVDYVRETDINKLKAAGFREEGTLDKVMKAPAVALGVAGKGASAGVLKVLEQTTRPLHAVATAEVEGIRALKRGESFPGGVDDIARGAVQGAANKRRDTSADVLTELGWKPKGKAGRIAKGVVSFAGDVVGDPLTYVTAGAGSVAVRLAEKAAAEATKKALKAGLSEKQAARLAAAAARQAVKRAPKDRGITVSVGGKEVPGARRGSAAAGRRVRKAAPKRARRNERVRAVRDDLRTTANTFAPGVRPVGVTHAENEAIRSATRTARSTISRKTFKARQEAAAVQKSIGDKNYQLVLDAIEARKIGTLPAELQKPARFLRSRFKYMRRLERQAGIPVGEIGRRGRIAIPKVTADVQKSARELAKARRARVRAEREHRALLRREGVAQGRAEVLSRSVGGRRAERVAERGKQYAGGAYGVRQASEALQRSAEQLADARAFVARMESRHAAVKEAASQQRLTRARALKVKAQQDARPRGYVPHVPTETVEAFGRRGVGKRKVRPGFAKGRRDQRPLAQLRQAEPGAYVEDPGVIYAKRGFDSASAQAAANLNRRLADTGRTVKPGPLELDAGQAIYHVRGSDIAKLDDKAMGHFADAPLTGRYVVLPEKAVDRALETVLPGLERHPLTLTFDRVQGTWKFLATQVNPGFHVRNLSGDTMNAFLAQPAPRLARSMGQSAQALRLMSRQERQLSRVLRDDPRSLVDRTLGQALDPAGRGIKVKGGERLSYEQLVREAEEAGAVRSGFVGGELHDLLSDTSKAVSQAGSRKRRVGRWLQNREDWARLATFIGARKKGLDPEAAAARAAKFHFDYRELSEFERRIMRRIMPFYTFTARNVPLQMQSLITRPGKFAQYQKLRENFAETFGINLPEFEGNLPEYEQRAAGLPIKWKGQEFTLSLGPSGLPLTDLNEIPTSLDPSKAGDEWLSKAMSMVTPAIKAPVELWSNFSFFFRDQIERDTGPLVPMSSLLAESMPAPLRKKLGVVDDFLDKRTGKRTWAWPAKLDYLANQLSVGPGGFIKRATTEDAKPGKGTGYKVAGYLGARLTPVDATTTRINNLYDRREELEKARAAMNQRGIYANTGNRAYGKLSARISRVNDRIDALKERRGDAVGGGRSSAGAFVDPYASGGGGYVDPWAEGDFVDPYAKGAGGYVDPWAEEGGFVDPYAKRRRR
jgi:hypothetical protein